MCCAYRPSHIHEGDGEIRLPRGSQHKPIHRTKPGTNNTRTGRVGLYMKETREREREKRPLFVNRPIDTLETLFSFTQRMFLFIKKTGSFFSTSNLMGYDRLTAYEKYDNSLCSISWKRYGIDLKKIYIFK